MFYFSHHFQVSMAKDNLKFTRWRTLMNQRRRIMSKRKRSRTSILEKLGVHSGFTSLWVVKMVPTTMLITVKSFTTTFTSNNRTMTHWNTVLQNRRTWSNKISFTTHNGTFTFTFMWCNCQRSVETIDKTNTVRWEVFVAMMYVELY